MNNKHDLKTFHDIFKVITLENLDRFMLDFYKSMHIFAEAKSNMTQEQIDGIEDLVYEWIDDGENNIEFKINGEYNGK